MDWVKNPKDFMTGILFLAIACGAMMIAQQYPMGTTTRMGAGYFPRGISALIGLVGLILIARSLWSAGSMPKFTTLKPLIVVLGAALLFGLTVDYLGLALATAVLVFVSSFASYEFRWKEALISSILFGIGVVVIFRFGLGIQLEPWPQFLR